MCTIDLLLEFLITVIEITHFQEIQYFRFDYTYKLINILYLFKIINKFEFLLTLDLFLEFVIRLNWIIHFQDNQYSIFHFHYKIN